MKYVMAIFMLVVLMVGCAPSGNAVPIQPQTPAIVDNVSMQVPPIPISPSTSKPATQAESKTAEIAKSQSQILFNRYDKFNNSREIYIMNEDGSNPVNLTNSASDDAWADLSPDKSKIIFERQTEFGNRVLHTMNADGSNETSVTNVTGAGSYYQFPAWSPDGKKVAFCKSRKVTSTGTVFHDIWIMNGDGTEGKLIISAHETELLPRWFPDGKKLAYLYMELGAYYIGIMNLDTLDIASKIDIQIKKPLNVQDIVWFDISPDGKKIAYSADIEREINNKYRELFIIDVDGDTPIQLTNNEFYDDTPCWSPDGLKIAYSTPDGIYTINVDGTNITKIVGTSAGETPKPVDIPRGGAPGTAGAPTFVGDIPSKWR